MARTMVGPISNDLRPMFLEKARQIEAAGGEVHRIKVEEQVEGVRCGVST